MVCTEARKNLPEKPPVGNKCARNLSSNRGSITKRLEAHPSKALQNEIRVADPARWYAWYLEKKELSKDKVKPNEKNAVYSEAQMTTTCYTRSCIPLHRYVLCPGLGLRPLLYFMLTK